MQLGPSAEAGETATDQRHSDLVHHRFAIDITNPGVVGQIGKAAAGFQVLICAVGAEALISFKLVFLTQGLILGLTGGDDGCHGDLQ